MKSTPAYMQMPKAQRVAIAALRFPRSPNHGLDLTQSNIIQVTVKKNNFILKFSIHMFFSIPIENMAIMAKVEVKYGITDLVFFSNS